MRHRFLLNDDGDQFLAPPDEIDLLTEEAVGLCPANVTTYLICPGGSTFFYPTRVGEVMQIQACFETGGTLPSLHAQSTRPFPIKTDYPTPVRSERLPALHAQGKDPFGDFLRALREAGKESFITYRMNDVHNPDDASGWNTSFFRRDHPDMVVDAEAVREGTGDWMAYCLDYSRAEVRAYILATIDELVQLYDFDGLELDWLRFPRHLSGTPEEVWEKRGVITEFTAQVRGRLDRSGKEILLAARVPNNLAGCRYVGLDIAEWARQGLIDFLAACPFLTSDYSPPIRELADELGDSSVPIYGGMNLSIDTQVHCPESLRAVALSLFDSGADGIYLFNYPCWICYLGAKPYDWLEGLDDPASCAVKPLLFAVSHQRARVAGVDLPGVLPHSLPAGEEVELTLQLPAAALPARRALFLVHSGGDVALVVNDQEVREVTSLRRPELFVGHIDNALGFDRYRPGPGECRTFQPATSVLRVGANRLRLTNSSTSGLEIARVNLGLW